MNKSFKQYLSEAPLKLVNYQEQSDEKDSGPKKDQKEEKTNDDIIDLSSKKKDKPEDKSEKPDKQDDESDENNESDPDKEGVIRTIKNAHLVYKRKDVDGTYVELWAYDINRGFKDEYDIRAAILNGTDINHKTGLSSDEQQSFDLWTCGGRQMMRIKGLEN